jgi:hypothetical protein
MRQRFSEAFLMSEVDTRDRFVHNQDGGIGGKSTSYQDPLLLTTGEPFNLSIAKITKVDLLESPRYRIAILLSEATKQAHFADAPRENHFVDGRGYSGRCGKTLRHVADLIPSVELFERLSERAPFAASKI